MLIQQQKWFRSVWKLTSTQKTPTFSLLGAIASSSSIKMMAGAFFSASSKAFLRLLSLSPASLLMISGPEIKADRTFRQQLLDKSELRIKPVLSGMTQLFPEINRMKVKQRFGRKTLKIPDQQVNTRIRNKNTSYR